MPNKLSSLFFSQSPTHKAAVVRKDEDFALAIFWYPPGLVDALSGSGETVTEFVEVIAFCSGEGNDGLDVGSCRGWV